MVRYKGANAGEDVIKIGRSSNIERRLGQYKGYQADGQKPEVLARFSTKDYEKMEKESHGLAKSQGL